MRLPFRRWRPSYMLLAWAAYWLGLVLVTLSPAIAAGWRLSQQPHGRGSASAGFGNGMLSANIIDSGRTVWAGSISVLTLALFVAVPPLLLWLVWLAGSPRTNNAGGMSVKNEQARSELDAAKPRIGIIDTSASSTSKRRAREES